MSMKMPVYRKKKRVKFKVCLEPGCGKDFWGHPIAKYCEEHRDIKCRVKPIKESISTEDLNLVLSYNNEEPEDKILQCSLDGCNTPYSVHLIPKQTIYPRYCQEHRNEFKRNLFIKNLTKVKR